MTSREVGRRAFIAASLALAACTPKARSQPSIAVAPLKSVAPFAVGTCIQAAQLDDPAFADLVAAQVSQLTPEWELKMEYVVQPDGGYRFDAPDRIAAFCADHGLRMFGHTLVWYAQAPDFFARQLNEAYRSAFRDAFAAYITAVVGRYKGRIVGWDVVNEPVSDDGGDWRDSLWSQGLGRLEHMRFAYQLAHAADPAAVLFLNDYSLETNLKKRATFMRLAEALLKAGAPLMGVGTQTHVAADLCARGDQGGDRADLASLGLEGPHLGNGRIAGPRSRPGQFAQTRSAGRRRSTPRGRRNLRGATVEPAVSTSPSGDCRTPAPGCVASKRAPMRRCCSTTPGARSRPPWPWEHALRR